MFSQDQIFSFFFWALTAHSPGIFEKTWNLFHKFIELLKTGWIVDIQLPEKACTFVQRKIEWHHHIATQPVICVVHLKKSWIN